MADVRRSKRLKLLHEQDNNGPTTQKRRRRGRTKPVTSTQVFRLLDLPKELRLLIYEFAFATSTRIVYMRLCPDAVYHTTEISGTMLPFKKIIHPSHSLLLANTLLYDEAIDLFYRDTWFDVQCHVDRGELTTRALRLGKVSNIRVFRHVQHLALQIHIKHDMDLFDWKHRLALLVSAIGRCRKLRILDIAFFWDWSGSDRLLEPSEVRPLMLALASLSCTTRIHVHWADIEPEYDDFGDEVRTWVPCDYRNMATELEDAIIL